MDLVTRTYFHKRPTVQFKGHREWVWSVAASEGGAICSGSQDKSILQWNPMDGNILKKFPPAAGAIVAMQFVGELLYFGCEKKVSALNLQTGQTSDVTAPCGNALVLCLLQDGEKLYVGYSDAVIRVWVGGQIVGTLNAHQGPVKVLAKGSFQFGIVRETRKNAFGDVYFAARRESAQFAHFVDGHALFSGGDDQSVVRFNTNTTRSTVLYQGYNGPVRALIVFKNAIYFSDGNNVRAQSIETGSCIHTMTGHNKPVFSLLRHRELLMSGSADNTVIIRNILTAVPICVLHAHTNVVKCMTMSGSMLYTGSSDKVVMSWDLREVFNGARNPDALQQLASIPSRGRAQSTAITYNQEEIEARITSAYSNPFAQNQQAAAAAAYDASGDPYGYNSQQLPQPNQIQQTANYGSVPVAGGAPPTTPGGYGSLPSADALQQAAAQSGYGSMPVGTGGYGSVPEGNVGGGYGNVPTRPNVVVNGGGYGNVPVPGPGVNPTGGYGNVPTSGNVNNANNNNNAYGQVPDTSRAYSAMPQGSIEDVAGYGVIPANPHAATNSGATNTPPVVTAPGYASLPTAMMVATAGSGAPPAQSVLNAPGYATLPTGPGPSSSSSATAAAAMAMPAPPTRRPVSAAPAVNNTNGANRLTNSPNSGRPLSQPITQQAAAAAPQQQQQQQPQQQTHAAYATALDPRYKKR